METGNPAERTRGKAVAGGPSEVAGGQSCSWLARQQLVDRVIGLTTQSSSVGKEIKPQITD